MKNETAEFLDLVEHLCTRTRMYVMNGSFAEVCAYLTGYAEASESCPISNEGWEVFQYFVCARCNYPSNYWWPVAIEACCTDDAAAIELLRTLLTDFCHKIDTMSPDAIIAEATLEGMTEDGEPELAMRALMTALLTGDRAIIEPLIVEHPDPSILWAGAYPPDVAGQLDALSRSQPIRRLPGSDDEEVRLMTTDYPFPITVKRIDGQWKIDVTPIIEIRQMADSIREQQPPEDSSGDC